MSKRIGNIAFLQHEKPSVCELCGKTAELRPYGPNGERICIDCAKKDVKTTERKMKEALFDGAAGVIVVPPEGETN